MIAKEFSRIFEMSVPDRILLVEEIWDSILKKPGDVPLTDSQKKELEKRINSYFETPEAGASWDEVKERIFTSTLFLMKSFIQKKGMK